MRNRDRDRQRVYDAEDAAFLDTSYAERVGEQGCRWLLARLVATQWWAVTGVATPQLRAARADSTRSTAILGHDVLGHGTAEIRIGPGMDQPHVLSHEVAHMLATPAAGHGARYRAAHQHVAAVLLGSHGANRLASSYARASLPVSFGPWPAPPDHGDGGLLAIWVARRALGRSCGDLGGA